MNVRLAMTVVGLLSVLAPTLLSAQQLSGDTRYYFVRSYQLYQKIQQIYDNLPDAPLVTPEQTLSYVQSIGAMQKDWGSLYKDLVDKYGEIQQKLSSSILSGRADESVRKDSKALYMLISATYSYSTILSGLSSYLVTEKNVLARNSSYIKIAGISNQSVIRMWEVIASEYGGFER